VRQSAPVAVSDSIIFNGSMTAFVSIMRSFKSFVVALLLPGWRDRVQRIGYRNQWRNKAERSWLTADIQEQ